MIKFMVNFTILNKKGVIKGGEAMREKCRFFLSKEWRDLFLYFRKIILSEHGEQIERK